VDDKGPVFVGIPFDWCNIDLPYESQLNFFFFFFFFEYQRIVHRSFVVSIL
jgi:hypothetical protein